MDAKRIGSVLMVGLVLLSAMVVLTGTAAGAEMYRIMFYGHLTNPDGSAVYPAEVSIARTDPDTGKIYWWNDSTDLSGYYSTAKKQYLGAGNRKGTYTMYINGALGQEEYISDFEGPHGSDCYWSYQWNRHGYVIPEFSTIAIPIASILGLLFFFNYRKHRKE